MTTVVLHLDDRDNPGASKIKETQRTDATFYFVMAIVSVLFIFAGFAPSFYLKSIIHAPPPLYMLTKVHGVVFTVWTILFLTQASLISADKPLLHRQLGMLGAILFGGVVVLGYVTSITAAKLGHAPPGAPPPLVFSALPLIGITTTLVLGALALLNRRRPDWHKRLMLATFFTFVPPAVGRIVIPLGFATQGVWIALGAAEALLVISMLYDYSQRRHVHPAYWTAGALFVALHGGVVWSFSSSTWLGIAKAVTQG